MGKTLENKVREVLNATENAWWLPAEPKEAGVMRRWVRENCTLRMQAVLITAMRGCDMVGKNDISKAIVTALRFEILNPSTPDWNPYDRTAFMGYRADLAEAKQALLEDMDRYPFHFVMHLLHAVQIAGCYHPDAQRRAWWAKFYNEIVHECLHCNPETQAQMEHRLRDR